jgi:hypothetical protein
MDLFGFHIPSLVGVGAAFTSVYGAFAKFDSDQSADNRQFVRDWLLGLKVEDQKWAAFFTEVFAAFFGPRHLSIKCITRSTILSAFIIFTLFFVWVGIDAGRLDTLKTAPGNIVSALILSIVCACVTELSQPLEN